MPCLSLPPCDQDPISDGGGRSPPSGDTPLVQDVLKNMVYFRQGLTSCYYHLVLIVSFDLTDEYKI